MNVFYFDLDLINGIIFFFRGGGLFLDVMIIYYYRFVFYWVDIFFMFRYICFDVRWVKLLYYLGFIKLLWYLDVEFDFESSELELELELDDFIDDEFGVLSLSWKFWCVVM